MTTSVGLVQIVPNGAFFGATFGELIGALSTSLQQLGYRVFYETNRIPRCDLTLVIGAHNLLTGQVRERIQLPEDAVLFNLEPLHDDQGLPWHPNYVELLGRHRVIDYSPLNRQVLADRGQTRVHEFTFGYYPLLPFMPPARRPAMVFFGGISERRKRILQCIGEKGAPLEVLGNSWGYQRDLKLTSAACVINIGRLERSILEVYRLWHCLCLGIPVLTEAGVDRELAARWQPYVGMTDDLCQIDMSKPLALPNPRKYREETAFKSSCSAMLNWLA